MKIDLLLVPMGASYAEMREAAIVAETAGFDGIWTWDHLRDPDGDPAGVPECWTVLTGLAEVTERVALGPLVLNVANRHPGLLANAAATLQQVSGGRLLLGLGAGGSPATPYAAEQLAVARDVEPDSIRRQHVIEAIQVMRRLWAGDDSDFEGRHYQLRSPSGYLRPAPEPPIIVGGFGRKMARVAGRWGDGFNTQALHPRLEELLVIARDTFEERGGDAQQFVTTVFAGLAPQWLRPDSPSRERLERLGVQRLILLVEPPFPIDRLELRRVDV